MEIFSKSFISDSHSNITIALEELFNDIESKLKKRIKPGVILVSLKKTSFVLHNLINFPSLKSFKEFDKILTKILVSLLNGLLYI